METSCAKFALPPVYVMYKCTQSPAFNDSEPLQSVQSVQQALDIHQIRLYFV